MRRFRLDPPAGSAILLSGAELANARRDSAATASPTLVAVASVVVLRRPVTA
jgi:hypothetical protein